jgi:hypothetical protein
MKLRLKAWVGIALFLAGIAMLMWSRMLPPSPSKGWLTMLGFGVGALPHLFAMITPMHRRRSLAFGVTFVLFGIYFGLPAVWATRPSWFQWVLLGGLLVAVAWGFREGRLASRRAPGPD